MKLFLLICLGAVALAYEDRLASILKSPKATLKLYSNFKDSQHLAFNLNEDRARFRLFKKNAEMVASLNNNGDETAKYGLNMFSTMTEEEKSQYLGLNVTGHHENPEDRGFRVGTIPAKKLWTNEGGVTVMKNQGKCGSCWSFGAVGGVETRYFIKSKVLRNFAEKEYLDCAYEGQRDGCKGGWMSDAYKYSNEHGGRLASTANYPYVAVDGTCKGADTADAAIAFKIGKNIAVAKGESANIAALAEGSIAMAFEVTNKFQQYRSGIIRDTTCTGRPNHAVTGVGYTETFVLVKNSWGSSWGDSGFVKFARNYPNCDLFKYSSYPELTETGVADSNPDPATDYRPTEDDEVNPTDADDCRDYASAAWCNDYRHHCFRSFVHEKCPKTCKKCKSEECPSGTIKCPDGVCRHEHMC